MQTSDLRILNPFVLCVRLSLSLHLYEDSQQIRTAKEGGKIKVKKDKKMLNYENISLHI
jgi:hypothetical protein